MASGVEKEGATGGWPTERNAAASALEGCSSTRQAEYSFGEAWTVFDRTDAGESPKRGVREPRVKTTEEKKQDRPSCP